MFRKFSSKPQPKGQNATDRAIRRGQSYQAQPQPQTRRSNSYVPSNEIDGRPVANRNSTYPAAATDQNNAMGDGRSQWHARPVPTTSNPVPGGTSSNPSGPNMRRARSTNPIPPPPTNRYSAMSAMPVLAPQPVSVPNPVSYPRPRVGLEPIAENPRMSVAIDFGTTFSGVSYGSSRIAGGRIQQILQWPGSEQTFRKIPTCLLYNTQGDLLAWGLNAKVRNVRLAPVILTFQIRMRHRFQAHSAANARFKLFLEPRSLREGIRDPRLPMLPPGKEPVDVIRDFLSCLWGYAKQRITQEIGAVADLNTAEVLLTVPAAWDAKGCDMMRTAALRAGVVQNVGARKDDKNWKDRLKIITEPEAAAVHCMHLTTLHQLQPSQTFMICDAGGGTVDLAVYKILGSMESLEIAEVCARTGSNCGSLFMDLRFRDFISRLLVNHPAHTDTMSLAYFQSLFSEVEKLAFRGEEDDHTMFRFACFNPHDNNDPTIGLINGEVNILGSVLRAEVFDPVIEIIVNLIKSQISRSNYDINALLLVGGFAGSEYLFKRIDESFGSRIDIARPVDADTATVRGAARYGLSNRALVSSIIVPRSYIMKVKLPAEPEDWQLRPAYVTQNDAGVHICTHRVQYLARKGAVLRKGQKITTSLCKYSQGHQDSIFALMLYTSNNDRFMRYCDEGETTRLCKWTVDLSSLPSFIERARVGHRGGFYTEFELSLELDSAEVRGSLLYRGQEWCRAVFEFLN